MKKTLDILSQLIIESKRIKLDTQTYLELTTLAEKLWAMRNKKFDKKTLVDGFSFKTSDGADGYVKIVINPRLPYIGYMETVPKFSRDPMDFVMELQPKEYESKKNLFLTIYHELLHAMDPALSTKMNMKFYSTYDEKSEERYWGHPIEFRTITNEFLQGLVMEFDRRIERIKNVENKKFLTKSLDNILNYFAKGEPLTKFTDDLIRRINDEHLIDNKISEVLADLQTNYPNISDMLDDKPEEPYYITYIELIKKYNPNVWNKFLSMLYSTVEEIKELIDTKKKG
jgi:hypothetical protein